MERVCVLIPVYNSEKTIYKLCTDLMQVFEDQSNFKIVLVNDGSKDSSDSICRQLYSEYSGLVTYVELSRNFGEHNALMAGLHYVTGDYCIMMDDDLQNPPQEARKLIEEIRKGYDVVYTYCKKRQDPLFRRLGSYFNDKVASLVMNKPSGLYLSSFKIINKFLINEIIKYDGQSPYIDGIIMRSTNRIGSVLVEQQLRRYGQSGYTLSKLLSLWGSMALNFSLIPLRLIGCLGAILTISSVVFAIHRRFFDAPYDPLTDFEILMTALLLLGGLLFFSIALMAEYIGRMSLFMNKQPQYIVRELSTTDQAIIDSMKERRRAPILHSVGMRK
jgi:undecaprenyl-phosphate 4-deoxy-4-formamido-L-arabinose transferase